MSQTFICDHCNQTCPTECATYFEGQHLCSYCLNERTLFCDHCGTRIWSDNNLGTDHRPLCQDCYDSCYNTCEDCGAVISHDDTCYVDDDDDTPYCENCVDSHRRDGIQSYYYRPDPSGAALRQAG